MNIWWIRRDLRLSDNQALSRAVQKGSGVVPVFILDDHLLKKAAKIRQAFLFNGLRSLESDLQRLGSRLIIRQGNPVDEITKLAVECQADEVFAEEDITPYALKRDATVGKEVNLQLTAGLTVHPVAAVTKPDGKPYTIFTPFSRAWKALPADKQPLPAPNALPPVPDLSSAELPVLSSERSFPAGEREALRRLSSFLSSAIYEYEKGRNKLDQDGTSALSPYLHFGMLSVRQAAAGAYEAILHAADASARAGCETWLNELIWREFYQSILHYFPFVLHAAFKPSMRGIHWRNSPDEFTAWQHGLTGYPVVDAGMRQLAATGWMHNRARMITASFLVKHLLINWQEGERWFMQSLVDADPAANNGGWQWTAGTGTDAVPYFRIFNPILQGKKYDPQGIYVRRWVPELIKVPTQYIHTPWEMAEAEQRSYQAAIGRDYPAPIVEHNYARRRVLAAYSKVQTSFQ